MKIITALVAVALTASLASAAPVVSFVSAGSDGVGNSIYQLLLDTDGQEIQGLELTVNGPIVSVETLEFGISVTPVWSDGKANLANPALNPDDRADSYINRSTGQIVTEPSLNAEVAGSQLKGTAAFPNAPWNGSDILMAQIVLAPGAAASYQGLLANAAAQEISFSGEIPEPATLGLLSLGGLALIRRRR